MYLHEIIFKRGDVASWDKYPFNIPSIKKLENIVLPSSVIFIVGENGSGKSTIIETIAVALSFNAERGTKNFNFSTRQSHSNISDYLKLIFSLSRPPKMDFFKGGKFL